ncbi:hypothetical protein ES703_99218 [subsurface metagenome]
MVITCLGWVDSTKGVKFRRSENNRVTLFISPSRDTLPDRISSRISWLTYFPKESFIDSDSFNPLTIRLKPSVTDPISSFDIISTRTSRFCFSTSFMAASIFFKGVETLLETKTDNRMEAATQMAVITMISTSKDERSWALTIASALWSACAFV